MKHCMDFQIKLADGGVYVALGNAFETNYSNSGMGTSDRNYMKKIRSFRAQTYFRLHHFSKTSRPNIFLVSF